MKKFKKDDVVKLKTDSPEMTVESFTRNMLTNEYNEDRIRCTWFDEGRVKSECFDADALVKVR